MTAIKHDNRGTIFFTKYYLILINNYNNKYECYKII